MVYIYHEHYHLHTQINNYIYNISFCLLKNFIQFTSSNYEIRAIHKLY